MATTQIKNGYNGGTDAQLLVNPDGSINVNGSSGGGNASVAPDGGPLPGSSTTIGAEDPNGNLAPLLVDNNGALIVNTTGTSVVTGSVTTTEKGLNSFKTTQYTVGTSVMQITPTPLTNRSSISLRVTAINNSAIYIGNDNTLTTSTGYPLYNGDTLQMDLTPSNSIYAISDSPGQTLFVLEIA